MQIKTNTHVSLQILIAPVTKTTVPTHMDTNRISHRQVDLTPSFKMLALSRVFSSPLTPLVKMQVLS